MTSTLPRWLERRAPGPPETAFLRALLLDGPAASEAWAAWVELAGDPADAMAREHRYRRLGALVAAAEPPVTDGRLGAALRAAVLREELRYEAVRAAAADSLERLARAGLRPIVLNGVVHAELAYPEPGRRHTHDVDVLVTDPVRGRSLLGGDPGGGVRHANGTAVSLWPTPYPLTGVRLSAEPVPLPLAGVGARGLAPVDALVAAAIHGFRHGRTSLVWAADAYLTIARRRVDWDAAAACPTSAVPALALTLAWLRDSLGAPVPASVLDRLVARSRGPAVTARVAGPALWRRAARRYAAVRGSR